jgi:hypothetical protein
MKGHTDDEQSSHIIHMHDDDEEEEETDIHQDKRFDEKPLLPKVSSFHKDSSPLVCRVVRYLYFF